MNVTLIASFFQSIAYGFLPKVSGTSHLFLFLNVVFVSSLPRQQTRQLGSICYLWSRCVRFKMCSWKRE